MEKEIDELKKEVEKVKIRDIISREKAEQSSKRDNMFGVASSCEAEYISL